MKRKLFILAVVTAVFATMTSCGKKESKIYFQVIAGFPGHYTSGDFSFSAEGGSLEIPVAVFWSTDNNSYYIGLERLADPEKLIFTIDGDGFDLDEMLPSKMYGVRSIGLTANAYEGNVPRECRLFITAWKGKKSKTLVTTITQYPPGVDTPEDKHPIVWEEY